MTIFGYGITSKDIKNRVVKDGIEKILDFAPHFKEEILGKMKEEGFDRVEDYIAALDDYLDGNVEFALIREAIFEQEGLVVSAYLDIDGTSYLLYNKEISHNETIDDIINKYVNTMFGQDVKCDYHIRDNYYRVIIQ